MMWRFSGTYTALVTPFTRDGQIDWTALDLLVDKQLAAGIDGLVILGTTGEAPTVHGDEAVSLLCRVRDRVGSAITVIAGVGGNDTLSTIQQAQMAEATGVDGLLVTCPYYSKPSQPGLIQHFEAVATAVSVPVLLYNIKGRTAVNLEVSTILELARVANIVGMKEANSEMDHVLSLMAAVPKDFAVLSGNDDMALSILALGGAGLISTLANLLPEEVKEVVDEMLVGRWLEARALHNRLLPLMRGCMLETNPIPIKTALAWRGDIGPTFRSPICSMQGGPAGEWRRLLEQRGFLPGGAAASPVAEHGGCVMSRLNRHERGNTSDAIPSFLQEASRERRFATKVGLSPRRE
ncbi:4-hydroxy-tetrahydrodipicolinate synthase [Halomonas sp. I1]|uniref:4-hydroxy-tetrahydrodipicolinate synthase n=1 Tax=Halomonas sp. I1 TaxID=393536 RepID=UPI0028DD7C74|nr:4-hydroxy-tetrahydrodipicolinate synthase [Halomonas sp. I1]MDT8894014.1 4-hydroxy-tetrahydrodipicolinate synthase [Halomonas sp. I1]